MFGAIEPSQISLRGVQVHNLKSLDLDLPLGKLIGITGVSGAGKSSLAFDTLFAEGQRRFLEGFSASARQQVDQLPAPEADEIRNVPVTVAIRPTSAPRSPRVTLGTLTELDDLLRPWFAAGCEVTCPNGHGPIRSYSPKAIHSELPSVPSGTRALIIIRQPRDRALTIEEQLESSRERGLSRLLFDSRSWDLSDRTAASGEDRSAAAKLLAPLSDAAELEWIVDRLTVGTTDSARWLDSLERAFRKGDDELSIGLAVAAKDENSPTPRAAVSAVSGSIRLVDGKEWIVRKYSRNWHCAICGIALPAPEAALFNFQSALGACPSCRGSGQAPRSPTVKAAESGSRPVTIARPDLVPSTRSERSAAARCPDCHGSRLLPMTKQYQLAGLTISDWRSLSVAELTARLPFTGPSLNGQPVDPIIHELQTRLVTRLDLLTELGLEYLTLDRPAGSLSTGELQRAAIATALGSNLVETLIILDEPTTGLHPREVEQLVPVLHRLRDAGNTVLVVEHDPAVLDRCDWLVELGPGSGSEGGQIVTCGPVRDRQISSAYPARAPRQPIGWLSLDEVCTHNLRGISVRFPLGVLCAVTGVSGAGKSSLLMESLVPALQQRLGLSRRAESESGHGVHSTGGRLSGAESISHLIAPESAHASRLRSARQSPATLLKIDAELRQLLAATEPARVRNYTASTFNPNSAAGGRCPACEGTGVVCVDLQFLPDLNVVCPTCQGQRFKSELLEIKYRGLNLSEILSLTLRDAFTFFRGQVRIQRRVKMLLDLGLDDLQIGQPLSRCSDGERQRSKLASALVQTRNQSSLICLDEPTAGLSASEVGRLLSCFDQLLNEGHSLIVIEHHPQFLARCDHLIDLGPGSGPAGGQIVISGAPEQIAACAESVTGRFLRAALSR